MKKGVIYSRICVMGFVPGIFKKTEKENLPIYMPVVLHQFLLTY